MLNDFVHTLLTLFSSGGRIPTPQSDCKHHVAKKTVTHLRENDQNKMLFKMFIILRLESRFEKFEMKNGTGCYKNILSIVVYYFSDTGVHQTPLPPKKKTRSIYFSFSCSFRQIIHWPPPWDWRPSLGNPGSATVYWRDVSRVLIWISRRFAIIVYGECSLTFICEGCPEDRTRTPFDLTQSGMSLFW